MKRILSLLAIVACSQPPVVSPAGPPIRSIPFAASNAGSSELMTAAFAGHVDVYPNAIVVTAVADSVRSLVANLDSGGGPDEVRVGLASGDRHGSWRVDVVSAAVPLVSLQGTRSTARPDSARFLIPGVKSTDLSTRWLVFQLSSAFRDPQTKQRVGASNFVQVPVMLGGE